MAMVPAPMPSAPGKTSCTFNLAEFHSQGAGSFSMAHRLNTDVPLALSAGVAYSADSASVRVGVAGEF